MGWMGEELRKLQNLTVDRNVSKFDLSVVQALIRCTFYRSDFEFGPFNPI